MGYNTAIEFLRASQAVAPTFAMTTYAKIIDLFQSGGEIPDIPSLTRRLQLELRINSTLTPPSGSKATAFATLQGLDTDDPAPAPAPTPAQPAPKPSGNGNKGSKANSNKDSKQRKCLCGDVHNYADCPYLIPSNRPEGWVPDPQTTIQVSDALVRSEKKQQTIRKLVEKAKGGGNNNNSGKKSESSTNTTPTDQPSGMPSSLCTIGFIESEEELTNTVVLDSGATNHVFNSLDRFKGSYTPYLKPDAILTGTNVAEVLGIGEAEVTVSTRTGPKVIKFRKQLIESRF